MEDPCLICPLATCNETDPRCGYRQSEEYQRVRTIRLAQAKRKRDRQRERRKRQQAAAEMFAKRRARLLAWAYRYRCRLLWESGFGTAEIAERLGVAESIVYNDLLPWVLACKGAKARRLTLPMEMTGRATP